MKVSLLHLKDDLSTGKGLKLNNKLYLLFQLHAPVQCHGGPSHRL